jgi:malonyl CoA-acyl carrier protein transacylase
MTAEVLKDELQRIDQADQTKYFSRGIDFLAWVDGGIQPPEIYLQGTPISMPLIFVTQLTNYFVNWSMVNFEADLVHSAFGHSQGVAAAVVVGLAKDKEQFLDLVRSTTKVMLYIGLHTQKAFDKHASMSYCMLAVLKLPLSTVQGLVKKFNRLLLKNGEQTPSPRPTAQNRTNGPVAVLLHNGKRSFVVGGQPESVAGTCSIYI